MGIPRRFRERRYWRAACLLGCVLAAGCGAGGHEVSGTVYLDGVPVADASVMFRPTAPGPAAEGMTDAQGRYRLQIANKFSVPAGEYVVIVAKQRTTGAGADEKVGPGGLKVEYLVPKLYGDPKSSGLTVQVPSDKYDLSLKSQ
jgi:hypothetical protein